MVSYSIFFKYFKGGRTIFQKYFQNFSTVSSQDTNQQHPCSNFSLVTIWSDSKWSRIWKRLICLKKLMQSKTRLVIHSFSYSCSSIPSFLAALVSSCSPCTSARSLLSPSLAARSGIIRLLSTHINSGIRMKMNKQTRPRAWRAPCFFPLLTSPHQRESRVLFLFELASEKSKITDTGSAQRLLYLQVDQCCICIALHCVLSDSRVIAFSLPLSSYLFFDGKLSCAQSPSSRTSFIISPSHSITIIPYGPCRRPIPSFIYHSSVLFSCTVSFSLVPSLPLFCVFPFQPVTAIQRAFLWPWLYPSPSPVPSFSYSYL